MPTFISKYEANFLRNELLISLVIIGLFIFLVEWWGYSANIIEILDHSRKALYTSIASISGSILGFTLAGVSIIFALLGNSKLDRVKESAHYDDIYSTFMSSIRYLAFTTFCAILGILLDKESDPFVYIFYLNCWAVLISSFRVARCVWILENLIDLIAGKEMNDTSNQ